jgi:transcriptional regulator
MYIPKYAKHDDPNLIREFIDSHPFATLITQQPGLFVNHFPFLLSHENERLVLSSHMARNNPQWKHIEDKSEVLIIFQGPHAYISPSMYVNKLNVPTWNCTAVHVYGRAKAIHDAAAIEEILTKTLEKFESRRDRPWEYNLPQDFRDNLIKAIVGFEIEAERSEGKFKLSQNRAPEDYEAVIANLSTSRDPGTEELLKYMAATKPEAFKARGQ